MKKWTVCLIAVFMLSACGGNSEVEKYGITDVDECENLNVLEANKKGLVTDKGSVYCKIDEKLNHTNQANAYVKAGYTAKRINEFFAQEQYRDEATERYIAYDNQEMAVGDIISFVNDEIDTYSGDTLPAYFKGILLVNKKYGLPHDYGETDPVAYEALEQLQEDGETAGYPQTLFSGYRTYDYQVDLYNSYVERDGKEAADRYSARPGFSEHQSGLCFDIGAVDDNYGTTEAGKWLAKHCAEYGFIIRYPQGKEDITGYQYEPWHVRYVGKKAAKEIMNKGIALEEYLGV